MADLWPSSQVVLDALGIPWALVDAQGRVQAFAEGFPTGQPAEAGTPLQAWYPQVPWPPQGAGPWRVPLDPARTLHLFPLNDDRYLALVHVHGSDLALHPVPAGKTFLNMLVHELRLPLTPIRGYSELMKQGVLGPVNERQQQVLETILRNILRADRLLDRLSLLGKIEAQRLAVHWQALPLRPWLQELSQRHQEAFAQAGLSLTLNVEDTLPPVWTDATWLERVLSTLLENARLYTPKGEVRLQARAYGDVVELAVEDTGIGIPQEEQGLVFQPFFRSSDPRVRQHQGWGMDLFVTYRLVRYLGGQMGFTSQHEKGSRFWVRLPQAPV